MGLALGLSMPACAQSPVATPTVNAVTADASILMRWCDPTGRQTDHEVASDPTAGIRLTGSAPADPKPVAATGASVSASAVPGIPPQPTRSSVQPAARPFDVAAERRRVRGLIDRSDPSALSAACELATLVATQSGEHSLQALADRVWVLEALVRRGRGEPVLSAGPVLFDQLKAAGAEHAEAAIRLAAALALSHDNRDELDSAMAWSERLQSLLDAQLVDIGPRALWRERQNHAVRLIDARRYVQAEALLRSILAGVDGQPDLIEYKALAQAALAGVLGRQLRFAESARANEAALEFRQTHLPDDRIKLAVAYQNVAVDRIRTGEFESAEALFRQALAAIQPVSVDVQHVQASIWENFSGLLVSRGNAPEAAEAGRAAIALIQASAAAGSAREGPPWLRLATAQMGLGQWGEAVRSLRRSLALLEGSGQRASQQPTTHALLALVNVELELGNWPGAEAALERARTAVLQGGNPANQVGHLHVRQARLWQAQGRDDDALRALSDADAAFAPIYPPTLPLRRQLLALRCQLDVQHCLALEQMVHGAERGADPALTPDIEAAASVALANEALRRDDQPAAARWATRAVLASHQGGGPNLQWQAFEALAQVEDVAGRRDAAILYSKKAVNLVQAMRQGLAGPGQASDGGFVKNKRRAYRQLTDRLMQAGRFGEALEVLRLLRQREQDDFSERADALEASALSLSPREQALLTQIDRQIEAGSGRIDARTRRLLSADRLSPQEKAELEAHSLRDRARRDSDLAALQAVLDEVRSGVTRQRPDLGAKSSVRHAAVDRPTDRHTLHAYFVQAEHHLSLLTIGPHRQQLHRLAMDKTLLDRDIAAFVEALQQRGDVLPMAQTLYRRFGAALDAAALAQGAQRIHLWLDGSLRYVPFGALHDGRRWMVEKYRIMLASAGGAGRRPLPAGSQPRSTVPAEWAGHASEPPSAGGGALGAHSSLNPTRGGIRLAAFGVSRAVSGHEGLPGVELELCGIVDGPVRGLLGPAEGCRSAEPARGTGPFVGQADLNAHFTEQRLRGVTETTANQRDSALLHIGTHFVLRPGSITRSWLLLGDGTRLGLDRIRTLRLDRTELVTLSACQSGLPGTEADGVEVEGLPATLLGRGARRVLASLWRIDDRRTALLMKRFYAELALRPKDFAGALRAAQLAALSGRLGPMSHPYHWAAFGLVEAAVE